SLRFSKHIGLYQVIDSFSEIMVSSRDVCHTDLPSCNSVLKVHLLSAENQLACEPTNLSLSLIEKTRSKPQYHGISRSKLRIRCRLKSGSRQRPRMASYSSNTRGVTDTLSASSI